MVPDLGDPGERNHPARKKLAKRIRSRLREAERYERALLVLDYRLAGLRYAFGLKPVEDLYYLKSQSLDSRFIGERITGTKRAIARALMVAEPLDTAYQCEWRKNEV